MNIINIVLIIVFIILLMVLIWLKYKKTIKNNKINNQIVSLLNEKFSPEQEVEYNTLVNYLNEKNKNVEKPKMKKPKIIIKEKLKKDNLKCNMEIKKIKQFVLKNYKQILQNQEKLIKNLSKQNFQELLDYDIKASNYPEYNDKISLKNMEMKINEFKKNIPEAFNI